MIVRSDLHAGATSYEQCARQVEYWKDMAYQMQVYAKKGKPWQRPPIAQDPNYPTYPTYPSYPSQPSQPSKPVAGVPANVWGVRDYSGQCG